MTPRIEKMVFGTYTMYSFGTTKIYSLKVGNEGRTDNMRSIFGRCIAIAMMAAIAVAWHSPPAQAEHAEDRNAAERAASQTEAAAKDATTAKDAADAAATAAKDAATDADTATADAEGAYDAIKDSDTSPTKKGQAQDAFNAASEAMVAANTAAVGDADAADVEDMPAASAKGKADLAGYAAGKEPGEIIDPFIGSDGVNEDGTDIDSPPTATTDTAWDYAATAKDNAEDAASADHAVTGSATANRQAAQHARNHALTRKSEAESALTDAEKKRDTAIEEADKAKAQAKIATAIAAEALELVAVAAEAARDAEDDPSQTLITDARDARDAADAAAADAAKYAADTTPPVVPPVDGVCTADNMEMFEGMCVDKCAADMMRDEDGMCMAMGPEEDMMLQVTPNGVGDLLMFGYWTTKGGRNTLLSLTNTGVFPGKNTAVRIIIFDMDGEQLESLQTCLSRGDSWTAAITPDEDDSALQVGNAGDCDDDDTDRRVTPGDNPIPLEADYGYLKAFTEKDSDVLSGSATIVNAEAGFSSIYNATSFMGHTPDTKPSAVAYALANEGGVAKEMLVGYWRGLESIGAMTQVVLTFPAGVDEDDEVSLWVTDQDGADDIFSPESISMDQRVNMCTFQASMSMDGEAELACNYGDAMRVEVGEGSFRILNTTAGDGDEGDSAMAKPETSLPVIGMVFQSFSGMNGDFDQAYPIQWMQVEGDLMPMAMMK